MIHQGSDAQTASFGEGLLLSSLRVLDSLARCGSFNPWMTRLLGEKYEVKIMKYERICHKMSEVALRGMKPEVLRPET